MLARDVWVCTCASAELRRDFAVAVPCNDLATTFNINIARSVNHLQMLEHTFLPLFHHLSFIWQPCCCCKYPQMLEHFFLPLFEANGTLFACL